MSVWICSSIIVTMQFLLLVFNHKDSWKRNGKRLTRIQEKLLIEKKTIQEGVFFILASAFMPFSIRLLSWVLLMLRMLYFLKVHSIDRGYYFIYETTIGLEATYCRDELAVREEARYHKRYKLVRLETGMTTRKAILKAETKPWKY